MGREDDLLALVRQIVQQTPDAPRSDGNALAELLGKHAAERDAMTIGSVRFDKSFNIGHIFTMITILVSAAGMLWYFSASQAVTRRDLDDVMRRGLIYAPRVDALVQSNQVQDERISNLAAAVAEIRKNNSETQLLLGGIREDMATIRAKLSIERRP